MFLTVRMVLQRSDVRDQRSEIKDARWWHICSVRQERVILRKSRGRFLGGWGLVLRNAKIHDRQNRLGFVVDVAQDLAKKLHDPWQGKLLEAAKVGIERSRLAGEDTLCDEGMSEKERKKLRQKRTAKARHWNLLTDMEVTGDLRS